LNVNAVRLVDHLNLLEDEQVRPFEGVQMSRPFDDDVIDRIDRWSKQVLFDKVNQIEVRVLASFFSKRNVLMHVRNSVAPIGHVVHYSPKNVDTTFAYVLLMSILCGNTNTVRLTTSPTIRSQQEKLIVSLRENCGFEITIAQSGDNDIINQKLARDCDLRVIWGGDSTIDEIRRARLEPWAREITFHDRRSIAVLDASTFLKNLEKTHLKLLDDILWMSQASCTSVRGIVWLGQKSEVELANQKLNLLFDKETRPRPMVTNRLPDGVLERFIEIQTNLLNDRIVSGKFEQMVNVTSSNEEFENLVRNCTCPGVVFNTHLSEVTDLASFKNRSLQTIVKILNPDQELTLKKMMQKNRICDRVVNPGSSMNFEWTWDGYDLISQLTHKVTWEANEVDSTCR
jgi:hypothetical protein